jgi:hypothetical protein
VNLSRSALLIIWHYGGRHQFPCPALPRRMGSGQPRGATRSVYPRRPDDRRR